MDAHLDLVVVAAGDEERLLLVEADAADGALVLVELLEEGAHPVVPQLDHTIVQTKTDFDEVKLEVGIGFGFGSYLARIHGLLGWKASPLTLGDLVSNLVNMVGAGRSRGNGDLTSDSQLCLTCPL